MHGMLELVTRKDKDNDPCLFPCDRHHGVVQPHLTPFILGGKGLRMVCPSCLLERMWIVMLIIAEVMNIALKLVSLALEGKTCGALPKSFERLTLAQLSILSLAL